MKPGSIEVDRQYLKPPFWRLLAALLAALLLVGTAWWWQHKIELKERAEQRELDDLRHEYQTITSMRETIEEFYNKFLALQNRGVIGQESRLRWLELSEEVAKRLELPKFSITMQPQTKLRFDHDDPSRPEVQATATTMALELGLWHEGDLLTMLNELQRRGAGLLWVKSCELRRNRLDADITLAKIRQDGVIAGRCELLWLTLPLKKQEDQKNDAGMSEP